MTSSACDNCGRHAPQALQHAQKIGERWIMWRECWECYELAEKQASELKAEAERDRAVKDPEPRRRKSAGGPFALQLEEDAA